MCSWTVDKFLVLSANTKLTFPCVCVCPTCNFHCKRFSIWRMFTTEIDPFIIITVNFAAWWLLSAPFHGLTYRISSDSFPSLVHHFSFFWQFSVTRPSFIFLLTVFRHSSIIYLSSDHFPSLVHHLSFFWPFSVARPSLIFLLTIFRRSSITYLSSDSFPSLVHHLSFFWPFSVTRPSIIFLLTIFRRSSTTYLSSDSFPSLVHHLFFLRGGVAKADQVFDSCPFFAYIIQFSPYVCWHYM
jgi:hypothetical protein